VYICSHSLNLSELLTTLLNLNSNLVSFLTCAAVILRFSDRLSPNDPFNSRTFSFWGIANWHLKDSWTENLNFHAILTYMSFQTLLIILIKSIKKIGVQCVFRPYALCGPKHIFMFHRKTSFLKVWKDMSK